tara:strand:- start:62 stop:286 length:225 start_codon:yes stop_codon:yes gene_type:complete
MEMVIMRNKICYIFANISLVTAMPVVLFFTLLGIGEACDIKTPLGFMFMMVCGGYITVCGCTTAINIKKAFKDT